MAACALAETVCIINYCLSIVNEYVSIIDDCVSIVNEHVSINEKPTKAMPTGNEPYVCLDNVCASLLTACQ